MANSVKLTYAKPKLYALSKGKGALACVNGSVAATSGWSCVTGTNDGARCDPNGAAAVFDGIAACNNHGPAAIGTSTSMGDTACDAGSGALNTTNGNVCAVGGDK